jgi:hypothetical protein
MMVVAGERGAPNRPTDDGSLLQEEKLAGAVDEGLGSSPAPAAEAVGWELKQLDVAALTAHYCALPHRFVANTRAGRAAAAR